MGSDVSTIISRLDSIEARLRRIEEEVVKEGDAIILDEAHLNSMREAARDFLDLSERLKGKWRGSLGSVEEVRKMRKHGRGY